MSGLCMAAQLKRAGQHDFVILEKSAGLGGTWWDNRYPGAHVDVPSPLYSFSFAPNPKWTRRFAAAAEIRAYMQGVAARFGVNAHLRLGQTVLDARFDEATGRWRICTAQGSVFEARFFVCSTGPLSVPRWPDIPGIDSFAGKKLHSAAWDGEVRAVLVVADTPKATSREAVRRLKALGLRPVLLTGDNRPTAEAVAAQVDIDEVIAARDEAKALAVVHDGLFLSAAVRLNVFVIGTGLVGSALLDQIAAQAPALRSSRGLDVRVAGVSNSRRMALDARGVDLAGGPELVDVHEPLLAEPTE